MMSATTITRIVLLECLEESNRTLAQKENCVRDFFYFLFPVLGI